MPLTRLAWWGSVLAVCALMGAVTVEPIAQQLIHIWEPQLLRPARLLDQEERDWIRVINAYRVKNNLPELIAGDRFHQAALSHSVDMLRNDFFEIDSPLRGTHQYRVWQTGITDARVFCYIFKTNISSMADTITSNASFLQNLMNQHLTHIGVGIVAGYTRDPMVGEVKFTTVELAERYVSLDVPGTGRFHSGDSLTLTGTIADGLRNPSLIVTRPDGRIATKAMDVGAGQVIRGSLQFTGGAGEYKVEVEAENKMGPLVTNLFPLYVDVPRPEPASDFRRARQQDSQTPLSIEEAKQLMFYLLNEERRKARLPALRYSFVLEALALEHSKDMRDHDYFAHVSPTLGDLQIRARARNLPFRLVAENIAIDQSLRKAHESLMGSPSHRSNILNPLLTFIGIGIVSGNDRRYGRNALWVTQNFGAYGRS